jgi:alkanesulfonate monooxygenase SsuD/methylene tetrahydromethanopterin reductase-like flavin-dependent oxidoreductase (luciferase family)
MPEYLSLKFAADEPGALDQNRLRMILIGSPEEVIRTIRELHARGFAEVKQWSPLQTIPNAGEVLSILIKRGVSTIE